MGRGRTGTKEVSPAGKGHSSTENVDRGLVAYRFMEMLSLSDCQMRWGPAAAARYSLSDRGFNTRAADDRKYKSPWVLQGSVKTRTRIKGLRLTPPRQSSGGYGLNYDIIKL